MIWRSALILFTIALICSSNPAEAKKRHHRHYQEASVAAPACEYDNSGRTVCLGKPLQASPMGTVRHRSVPSSRTVDANGNGVVVSHKTGAKAHVSPQHQAAFQAYIDDLESGGATIRFMGGYRRGHCWSGGLHPCGKAIDVCQLSRGRVDARCHLPGRVQIAAIAARHGLFEGGQWCHHDYGHAQVGVTAGACGTRIARHHHRKMAKL